MTNFSDTSATAIHSLQASNKQKQPVPMTITRTNNRLSPGSTSISNDNKARSEATKSKRSQEMSSKMRPTKHRDISKQSGPKLGAELWSSVEDLFWDHMKEVENKWNTLKLNDDIWAKLIYFERNRRLAKAYVSAPVLTVDGSTHGLDGFRIGLSGIDNTYRGLDSIDCLRSIGLGVKLKIDTHGNILIRRIAATDGNSTPTSNQHCSVWIKDWPSSSSTGADENCMMRRILKSDISYKLFDMRKFRLQLEKQKLNNEQNMDWRQCVSIISFVRGSGAQTMSSSGNDYAMQTQQTSDLLGNPCWLMLINIIAIDMIKNAISTDDTWNSHSPTSSVQNQSLSELKKQRDQSSAKSPKAQSVTVKPKSLKTSSSSSVLFSTTTMDLLNSGTASEQSTTGDSSNNLVSPSSNDGRVKKPRTTGGGGGGSKYRVSPMKNNAHYRRYQSIQQLSSSAAANNTIYTTFNSKYISRAMNNNNKLNQDCSSTSDYNSASRSTSSGQLHTLRSKNNHQQTQENAMHYFQSNGAQLSERYNGKVLFSRRALIPPGSVASSTSSSTNSPQLDLGTGKSVSLSTFDLSSQASTRRRLMHPSSIKMNYDYLTETEDLSEVESDEFRAQPMKSRVAPRFSRNETLERSYAIAMHHAASGNVMILGKHMNPRQNKLNEDLQSTSCCCGLMESGCLAGGERSRRIEHVNHNKCSAIQGCGSSNEQVNVSGGKETVLHEHKAQIGDVNKLSKSSIASSTTSSSGCPDNDYSMSHSSSSMSSSSTSGNGDLLFSQPTSSSGIAGSSTNDELDDDNKQSTDVATVAGSKSSPDLDDSAQTKSDSEKKVKIDTKRSSSDQDLIDTSKNNKLTASKSQVKAKKSNANNRIIARHMSRNQVDSVEPILDYCCSANSHQQPLDGCDCPSIETYTCHCCCDCYSGEDITLQAHQMSPAREPYTNYLDDDESIYQRLPAPAKASHRPQMKRRTTKTEATPINKTKTKKSDSPEATGAQIAADCSDGCETDPRLTKVQQKQSNGWLGKRRYSKILPKFIFSSSNNNNHTCGQQQQEKSSKFNRFTKSTLDLS